MCSRLISTDTIRVIVYFTTQTLGHSIILGQTGIWIFKKSHQYGTLLEVNTKKFNVFNIWPAVHKNYYGMTQRYNFFSTTICITIMMVL